MATSPTITNKSRARPFRCKRCNIGFKFVNSFNAHKKFHEKLDIANNETILSETSTTATATEPPPTSTSTATTKNNATININDNLEYFKCNICSRQCQNYNLLQKHLLVHSDEKPFKCDICSISFKQMGNLTSHKKIHNGFNYTCTFCGKTFNKLGNLQVHENRHKSILNGSGQIIDKQELEQINASAQMEKQNNSTDDGDDGGGNNKKGGKGANTKKPRRKSIFPCTQCDKTFLHKCYLTYHERTHTGDKPFKCSQCPVRFADKSNLRKHMRIHTGEKPFVCDICFKGFNQISSLSIHKRTHITYRPFECSHCQKAFGSNEELIVHLRIHGERLPFKCSECHLEFREHCNLKSHIKMHMETSPSLYRTITIRTFNNGNDQSVTETNEKPTETEILLNRENQSFIETIPNTKKKAKLKKPVKLSPVKLIEKALPVVVNQEECNIIDDLNDLPPYPSPPLPSPAPPSLPLPSPPLPSLPPPSPPPPSPPPPSLPPPSPPSIIIDNELIIKEEDAIQPYYDESEVKFDWYNVANPSINNDQENEQQNQSSNVSKNNDKPFKVEPSPMNNDDDQMMVDDDNENSNDNDHFNTMDSMFDDDNSRDSIPIQPVENQVFIKPKLEFPFDKELKIILHKIKLPIVKRKTINVHNLSIKLKDLTTQQYFCRIVTEKSSTNKSPIKSNTKKKVRTQKNKKVIIKKKKKKLSNNNRRKSTKRKIENRLQTEPIISDNKTIPNPNNSLKIDLPLKYNCPELNCQRKYQTSQGLQRHLLLTHRQSLKCSICNEILHRKTKLIHHMKEKHSIVMEKKKYKRHGTAFKCTTGCHQTFKNAQQLSEHDCLFIRVKSYICDICKKSFYSKDQIRAHLRTVHTNLEMFKRHLYKCSVCNKSKLMYKHQFTRHMKVHGLERNRECNECGKKFKTTGHLYNHKKTHLTELFKCAYCGKGFKIIGNLQIHEIRHRVMEHPKFECTICRKQFSFKHKLTYHMRIHTGERPYACPMCPARFADGSNLRAHKRIHTGEKPFKCLTCSKTFNQLGSLNIHKKSHVEYKPFRCDRCGKRQTSELDLITHLRKRHGDRRLFKCRLCDREFEQLCNYKSHRRLHYGKELTNAEKNYRNKWESIESSVPTHLLPLDFAQGPAPLPAASLIFFPPEFQTLPSSTFTGAAAAATATGTGTEGEFTVYQQLPLITYDINNLK